MEDAPRRTPEASLKEVFLKASEAFPEERERAEVVGEALDFLQRGFDAHYDNSGRGSASDDDILVGDNDYAWAVETIARLDEPRFVTVASRMIRDGSGRISSGANVALELWTPHLAGLLDVISGEGQQRSEERIRAAAAEVSS
ncbi:MAG: hypothetical protein ACRDSJ_15645 [Rubrobacteraceae bacterium]